MVATEIFLIAAGVICVVVSVVMSFGDDKENVESSAKAELTQAQLDMVKHQVDEVIKQQISGQNVTHSGDYIIQEGNRNPNLTAGAGEKADRCTCGNKEIITNVLPFTGSKGVESSFSTKTINEIVKACVEMGKVRTGALIVIEGKQPLGDFERTGIEVDGIVTSQLLINIFEHNTPLHDGAVIVRGNRITSATCYLPLSDNMSLDKNLGTRHRAGVGISEVTDAVTVIVSEETGKISVAYKGGLERNLDAESLKVRLQKLQPESEEDNRRGYKFFKGRSKQEKVEKEK